jgi:hypothetical protein
MIRCNKNPRLFHTKTSTRGGGSSHTKISFRRWYNLFWTGHRQGRSPFHGESTARWREWSSTIKQYVYSYLFFCVCVRLLFFFFLQCLVQVCIKMIRCNKTPRLFTGGAFSHKQRAHLRRWYNLFWTGHRQGRSSFHGESTARWRQRSSNNTFTHILFFSSPVPCSSIHHDLQIANPTGDTRGAGHPYHPNPSPTTYHHRGLIDGFQGEDGPWCGPGLVLPVAQNDSEQPIWDGERVWRNVQSDAAEWRDHGNQNSSFVGGDKK